MVDKITPRLTDKECEILIKDVVTFIMMNYALGDDGLVHITDVKAKTYQIIANVINDVEHSINDMSDLVVVALTTSMLSSKIYERKERIMKCQQTE